MLLSGDWQLPGPTVQLNKGSCLLAQPGWPDHLLMQSARLCSNKAVSVVAGVFIAGWKVQLLSMFLRPPWKKGHLLAHQLGTGTSARHPSAGDTFRSWEGAD